MKEHHLPDNPDIRAAHYCDEYTINTPSDHYKNTIFTHKTPFFMRRKVEEKVYICDGVRVEPVVRGAMTGGEVSPVAVCG